MTKIERVRQILNDAVTDGTPSHGGKKKFWNLPLDEFKALKVSGHKVVETDGTDRGARSALVKSLKGEPPFDENDLGRMPLDRPPVAAADIAFIQQWIDDGCPDDEMGPTAP